MPVVELAFPIVASQPIPADHGYPLYAAVSRLLPELHSQNSIAICPIAGRQIGQRLLALTAQSRLRFRVDTETLPVLLKVAGRELTVAGVRLRVGVPSVRALIPAATLRSRLVVIKIKDAPSAADLTTELFRQAARRQLDTFGIGSEATLSVGKRRTLRIKDKEVVGYELIVEHLTAEESLTLQEHGLGGRRHMGCGVFVPVRDGEADA